METENKTKQKKARKQKYERTTDSTFLKDFIQKNKITVYDIRNWTGFSNGTVYAMLHKAKANFSTRKLMYLFLKSEYDQNLTEDKFDKLLRMKK